MNCNFSQMITLHCPEPAKLIELIQRWDIDHASSDIVGYMGTRVLADREETGRYVCVVEFGIVDPAVSAADEAASNNERPETQAMAAEVAKLIEGALVFHDFDEIYRTDQ